MTEIVFVRHGETDWNRRQCFQGQLDVPLNSAGMQQAERLGRRLAGEHFDGFFTSDLQRARQTAAPLAAAWQREPVAVQGLREQGFGVWEGLDFDAIQARYPELWPRWLAHDDPDFALPGGESLRGFSARVLGSVSDIAALAGPGQRLLVVTHGGVLDMLWRSAHALPLLGQRQCEIPNTGINRLRWAGGALRVEAWADASHLDEVMPTLLPR